MDKENQGYRHDQLLMNSYIKGMKLSSTSLRSNLTNTSALSSDSMIHSPYLAIHMQMETSAQEIFDTTFEHVDSSNLDIGARQESTSMALHLCKRKVLKPYFRLLSVLGWRPIMCPMAPVINWYAKILNYSYPIAVAMFILSGYVLQYASCFRQDGFPPYSHKLTTLSIGNINGGNISTTHPQHHYLKYESKTSHEHVISTTTTITTLKCSGNFVSLYLIPDILHFFAYLFVLQLLRTPECEKLQNLLERVFLQTVRVTGWSVAHKKLVHTLRSFLWLCLAWVALSVLAHTLHIIAFQEICFTWMEPEHQSWIRFMTAMTILSLTWNDIICAAIVTSYSLHCQLNIHYISNLCTNIREKRIDFQEFSKRVEESRKFIDYLNKDQALGVSLLIVNFGCRAVVAAYGLISEQVVVTSDPKTAIVVLTSAFLWISLLSVPIFQAMRLSNYCHELRSIGIELRSRPFGYQDTPQDDLNCLLVFTSSLRMEAKMLYIPIRSSSILAILIAFIFTILFLGQAGLIRL